MLASPMGGDAPSPIPPCGIVPAVPPHLVTGCIPDSSSPSGAGRAILSSSHAVRPPSGRADPHRPCSSVGTSRPPRLARKGFRRCSVGEARAGRQVRNGARGLRPRYGDGIQNLVALSVGSGFGSVGWDESVRLGAGSQWIVAARPLCHLQCPVAYLSRLQRILPAASPELRSKATARDRYAAGAAPSTRALGGRGPLLRVGRRTAGSGAASLAWILT